VKYKIVDNFLKPEDLEYLQAKLPTLKPKPDIPTSFYSKKSLGPDQNTIDSDKLLQLEEHYVPHAMEILRELAPRKINLVDDVAFNLQSTPPHYTYPIHLDSNQKVLSGVVYLQPTESTGTFLHKNSRDIKGEEVPWKVNRAFFFSRNPVDSWHSYKGDEVGVRWVLVFNLLTSKLRKHEIKDRGFLKYTLSRIRKESTQGVETSMR